MGIFPGQKSIKGAGKIFDFFFFLYCFIRAYILRRTLQYTIISTFDAPPVVRINLKIDCADLRLRIGVFIG